MIDFERLNALRNRMHGLIDREIQRCGHHKSYEGSLSLHFGGRFSEYDPYFELSCYVSPVISGRSITFESLDEYPFFEVTEAEYSSSITSDITHVNLKMRDIDDIMSIVVSKNRQFWYKEVGDGYAIHIINDIFTNSESIKNKISIINNLNINKFYNSYYLFEKNKFNKLDWLNYFRN